MKKISPEILERTGVVLDPLNKALEKEGGFYFFILEFFGYEMNSDEVNKNGFYNLSTAISHMQNLSSTYCNRKISILSKGLILVKHN